ncbi:MAG: thioredoxin family protein [Syntrophomonadaceae bacterium]|nr:thioredoxin family protein [Syntrophomonadaceae bacterium]
MNKNVKIALYLIIGIVLIASAFSNKEPSEPPDSQSSNTSSGLQAFEEARENGESIWLLFRSDTCEPCIELAKTFNDIAPEYEGKVHFISIDVNDANNTDLVKEWEIQYVPTSFILDAEGNVNYQNIGVIPTSELKNELDKVVE